MSELSISYQMRFRGFIRLPTFLCPPESVSDIAVVGAVPARGAAIHYEFLPAVHASQMTLGLRALPDRTCIAVTHRPAAIRLCDVQLEVSEGHILVKNGEMT